MALQLTGLALKLGLSSLLILGGFGLPGLGARGGAIASVIVFWALFVIGFAYMHRSAFYRRFVIDWTWPRWSAQRDILRLGIPMSLSYALESTSFTAITLLAARLGTTAMSGHQVVANLAALCFMLPLSLSIATATLTAQAIGAGDPRRARETALTGLRIAAFVAAITVLTVWWLRGLIVRLYSRDPAVVAMALDRILVPLDAGTRPVWDLDHAVGDLEWLNEDRIGPILPFKPMCRLCNAQEMRRELGIEV